MKKLENLPVALSFNDVILLPSHTSIEPKQVDLTTVFARNIKLQIPVAASPMDTVTEWRMAVAMAKLGGIGIIHRNMSIEEQFSHAEKARKKVKEGFIGAAINPVDEERAVKLSKVVDVLVTDVAHFDNERMISATKRLVKKIDKPIVIGNLGTKEGVLNALSKIEDAAGLRMGIGSGSICITGVVTGVSSPTLFAVAQAREALEELGIRVEDTPIIADGGIKTPGDGAKALVAGATSLMLGGYLAGTEEAPGKTITINGKKYKEYRGMGSKAARKRRYARDRYGEKAAKDIEEGVEGYVQYKGRVEDVVKYFVAGLQAALGYIGAKNISQAYIKGRFALVHPTATTEINVHDIYIKKE